MSAGELQDRQSIVDLLAEIKSKQDLLAKKIEEYQEENHHELLKLEELVSGKFIAPFIPPSTPTLRSERYSDRFKPVGTSFENLAQKEKEKAAEEDKKSDTASSPGLVRAASYGRQTSDSLPESTGHRSVTQNGVEVKGPRLYPGRVVLTTYPGQVGIKPLALNWGDPDPRVRGPILVSRSPASLKYRNAIGAHSGSYSIYRALAVAIGALDPYYKPNLHNTHPAANVGPFAQWGDVSKIVSLDPYGHLVSSIFAEEINQGFEDVSSSKASGLEVDRVPLDIRPTIAITKAHVRIPEITAAIQLGRLKVDGKTLENVEGDLAVTKAAIEPVWYLPGVAARFGVDETTLRRALFEDTGGMYPELITRPDLKVFLPPIGGLTAYVFGPVEYLSDPSKKITARVHDECNGSDVFGSDICTCRPYLTHAIEACAEQAQQGGVGLIVYFRKEGRALGEVTKYLVYNARKRGEGGDTAANYFARTEGVAGVKDMRFQALMPDVLHWFGITKIDRFVSMSNMKYEAIVEAGIPILERVEIPPELLPPDAKVEIDAKIAAGYFTSGKVPTSTDLDNTKGRTWEDVIH